MRKKILFIVLLLLCSKANSSLVLSVGEEIGTGGSSSTTVMDQPFLFANLTNGFGSASLSELKSFNQDTNTGGSFYFNRSSWTLTDLIFSGGAPGTSMATVGIGGQLTAALNASVSFGGFTGASAAVRVRYGLSYDAINSGGLLFEDMIGVGGFGGILEDSKEINQFVGTVLDLPVDIPITLSFILETVGGLDVASGEGTSNAANDNGLLFNSNEFFDIQTLGVTANAGDYIIDNRIAAPIPLPAAFWLFGSTLLGLFGYSRKRAAR